MAFRKVSSNISYPLKDAKAGDILVNAGVYTHAKDGVYGLTHMFKEKETAEVIGLSGGQLNFMVEEGIISLGKLYRVHYKGKQIIKKGPMAGKESHSFEVEEDDSFAETPDKIAETKAQTEVDTSDISL